jgi:hypothetical protein
MLLKQLLELLTSSSQTFGSTKPHNFILLHQILSEDLVGREPLLLGTKHPFPLLLQCNLHLQLL